MSMINQSQENLNESVTEKSPIAHHVEIDRKGKPFVIMDVCENCQREWHVGPTVLVKVKFGVDGACGCCCHTSPDRGR
jgi:hypothetical protein